MVLPPVVEVWLAAFVPSAAVAAAFATVLLADVLDVLDVVALVADDVVDVVVAVLAVEAAVSLVVDDVVDDVVGAAARWPLRDVVVVVVVLVVGFADWVVVVVSFTGSGGFGCIGCENRFHQSASVWGALGAPLPSPSLPAGRARASVLDAPDVLFGDLSPELELSPSERDELLEPLELLELEFELALEEDVDALLLLTPLLLLPALLLKLELGDDCQPSSSRSRSLRERLPAQATPGSKLATPTSRNMP